jgi:hypothetical protein
VALGDLVDAVRAIVAAHGVRIRFTHQGDEPPHPGNGVVARVVRDRQVTAGFENSGDLGERESWCEAVQRLCCGDDVEMARQKGQGFDLANDVETRAESGRKTSNELNRSIDAEDFVAGIVQHRSKPAAARPEVENPHTPCADHPSRRSFWIGIPPRRHSGNFSGARPAG